jgi:hypothetical protein
MFHPLVQQSLYQGTAQEPRRNFPGQGASVPLPTVLCRRLALRRGRQSAQKSAWGVRPLSRIGLLTYKACVGGGLCAPEAHTKPHDLARRS